MISPIKYIAEGSLLNDINKNIPEDLKSLLPDTNIFDLIGRIINFAFTMVGVISVAFIVYGGIMYIIAGGQQEKTQAATRIITNAIIGIVIALAALAILYTVKEAIGAQGNLGITTPQSEYFMQDIQRNNTVNDANPTPYPGSRGNI